MRKLLSLSLALLLLLAGCVEHESPAPEIPALTKGDTVARTLFVYIMAENSLGRLYVDYDLEEIRNGAAGVNDDSRLFVYVDNCDTTSFPAVHQFHYSNDELHEKKIFSFDSDPCSSDTATLGKVLDVILADYPTKKLDIIMWSHADGWLRSPNKAGWLRSVGIDNGKNNYTNNVVKSIEMEELAVLLKRLPVKVDRLMFDACLMQGVEVAYALRDAADWIIASPAEIPGNGAPYDKIVPAFFSEYDGVEGIMDEYKEAYDLFSGGVVLSAVCTAHMQELADVTRASVKKYLAAGNSNVYDGLFSYVPGGAYYSKTSYPAYYDINAVMKGLLAAGEYNVWRAALDKAVPYLKISDSHDWFSALVTGRNPYIEVDTDVCSGMSMYVPQDKSFCNNFNRDFKTTEWYKAAGWDEAGW